MVSRDRAEVSSPSTQETAEVAPSHILRTQRYTEIQARRQRGESISHIAKDLALDRKTVHKYATAPTCPSPTPSHRGSSLLDPYIPQLQTLWEQGKRNVEALWAAAQAAGYPGSRVTVQRWVTRHRRHPSVDSPPRRPKPRQVAAWYLSRWDHLTRTTTRPLSLILTDPECQRVYTLTHPLHTIIRYRRSEALTTWLAAAEATKIPELVRFAAGIRHDEQAVRNGCMVIWSQGIVEGFNNQIKRLKRIMYGRARFDLLRKRILLS
ncbi:MAG: transposase [Firmicutes bacterium]|nr:transposase [Bacillota bacterium]